jgi:protein-histidine pros-kinase
MTAHAMGGDRERRLEAGIDTYIAKPIKAREVMEAIHRLTAPSSDADCCSLTTESVL